MDEYKRMRVYFAKVREAVRDLDALLENVPELPDDSQIEEGPPDTRPQFERVCDALSAGGRLTVAEIADRTRIPHSSVRMILYSNKEKFTPTHLRPRHVLWTLVQAEECVPA